VIFSGTPSDCSIADHETESVVSLPSKKRISFGWPALGARATQTLFGSAGLVAA
jgi:hypothetical protein